MSAASLRFRCSGEVMDRTADLRILQEYTAEGTRRILQLTHLRNQDKPLTIFFEMVGDHQAPIPRVLDGFVFAIIFYAMQLGQDIRVHGTMTGDALRNLNEFQEAWVLWRPQRYRKIQIIPDEITERLNPQPR